MQVFRPKTTPRIGIGVHADEAAVPGARLEQLALGVSLLLAACQPSAASPPEQAIEASDASAVRRRCLAETHPIVVHEIDLPQTWLVLTTADASDSLPLTGGGHVYGAVWSPDGRSMALRRRIVTNERGNAPTELILLDVDGADEVTLFEDSTPYVDNLVQRSPDGPTWSPDGRWLAFASQREADQWRIWAISRSGGQLRLLLPDLEVPHFYPRWSTLATLAYVAEVDGRQDLFVVDPNADSIPENLTRGRLARPESPSWSPDGRFIAFSAEEFIPVDPEAANRDIYTLEVGTGDLVRATDDLNVETQPAWSPDGKLLLFSSNAGRAFELDPLLRQWSDLWTLPLDENRRPIDGTLATQLRRTNTRSKNDTDWYEQRSCDDGPRPKLENSIEARAIRQGQSFDK